MLLSLFFRLNGLAAVAAAAVAATTSKTIDATFEDIEGVNPVLGSGPPTPYHYLDYIGFGLGAPVPGSITIEPSSPPNAVFAPYLLTNPLAVPTVNKSSSINRFDLKSVNTGCYAATENGAAAPAINCTILFTGTKTDGSTVTQSYNFGVGNALGIALGPVTMKKASFGKSFQSLTSFTVQITKAVLPPIQGVTAQTGSDNFVYTVYYKK